MTVREPTMGHQREADSCDRPDFVPFADDRAVHAIGALSIENGRACIAVHGALDITRDKAGLTRARSLRSSLDAIVRALEAADLPDAVADAPLAAERAKNPFA